MGSIGNSDRFSAYSFNNGLPTPIMDSRDRVQNDEEMRRNIEDAKKAGYQVITREYTQRGSSGKSYTFEESNISTPVKNGQISKNSNLWRHAQSVANDYNDVIIMQQRSAVQGYRRGRGSRGSFTSTGYEAPFVVLARRKK